MLKENFETLEAGTFRADNLSPLPNNPKQSVQSGRLNHLDDILKQLKPFDFRKAANIRSDDKIPRKTYLILTIGRILEVAKSNGNDLCHTQNGTYLYNGSYWTPIAVDELKIFLTRAAIALGLDQETATYHRFSDELVKQFSSAALNFFKDTLRDGMRLLNLENGTLEISASGCNLRQPSPTDFTRYVLPYKYSPKAKCPQWHAFLDEVLPDKESQMVLAEYFGYVFSDLKIEKILCLLGWGANGKSVVFDVIRALFGRQNVSHFSLSELDEPGPRSQIANKILNYCSEMKTFKEMNTFKRLVSGEPISARKLYENHTEVFKYAKLAVNCNELPKNVEFTNAFFRRLQLVPFDVTIPEARWDKKLASKIIKKELSGVLNWILDGLKRVEENEGFSECAAANRLLRDYKTKADTVAFFLEEEGYIKTSLRKEATPLKQMYGHFRTFCKEVGEPEISQQVLKSRLQFLGYEFYKPGNAYRVFAKREPSDETSAS